MKINDIVEVHDGSYCMTLVKGTMRHTSGTALQKRQFQVHGASGMYPTYRSHEYTGTNDTLLVDVKDSDFVLFTQERFCTVVAPVSLADEHDGHITIPRGTKRIHLTLL